MVLVLGPITQSAMMTGLCKSEVCKVFMITLIALSLSLTLPAVCSLQSPPTSNCTLLTRQLTPNKLFGVSIFLKTFPRILGASLAFMSAKHNTLLSQTLVMLILKQLTTARALHRIALQHENLELLHSSYAGVDCVRGREGGREGGREERGAPLLRPPPQEQLIPAGWRQKRRKGSQPIL